MKRVNIILTTYNGERYLSVLLDSLLAQTYENIAVYIRDDGSTDRTLEILEQYEQKSEKHVAIHILRDSLGNLGYVKNFIYTLQQSGNADYYAFCDQDDYWLPDKITNAVELLEMRPAEQYLLYSCAYECRDIELNLISKGKFPTSFDKLDVGKALSLYDGGWLLGFTLVMNNALKEKAFSFEYKGVIYSHDIWTQAVAVGFQGELIVDSRVGAYFRRHPSTTSIAESNISNCTIAAWKFRLDELLGKGKLFSQLNGSVCLYNELFGNQMVRKQDHIFLKLFGCAPGTHRIKKLLYPHRLKQSFAVELAWRFAILLGKI